MKKRTPLSIGATIQAQDGSSYIYVIDRVIGDGANSIVYQAHYMDNVGGRHDVRIKECYPYASDIQRDGTTLVWNNANEQTADKASFTNAYHKILEFQNTTNLRNSTAHIFDLCEANGTFCSITDVNEGVTFEQDNSQKLSDILKTTLALTRVVEKYHNNGYLHLDIKPSNFLVIPETRELVILFDVDSVASMDDIASGKVECVPYSKSWAAPEQMQGQIKKLCPATDIYSIGAILFRKVMGRAVENEDIGIFADWNFDGEMFDNVNPKIKRLLREIFRKTLAASIKRRYRSAGELVVALEEAVKTAEEKQYIISNFPSSCQHFRGRDRELNAIHSMFLQKKNIVYLHGDVGGIGKSELAKKFAETFSDEYDAIVFKTFINKSSIEEIVEDISIEHRDEKTDFKALVRVCKRQKILLIVDNLDVTTDADVGLDEFLTLPADILITTRTDFRDVLTSNASQISISHLDSHELFSVFENETNVTIESEDEKQCVMNMLKKMQYHTLAATILAKYRSKSGKTITELCEEVDYGFEELVKSEKIVVRKDDKNLKMQPIDILRITFNTAALSDIEKEVLTTVYFFGFENVTKSRFRQITSRCKNRTQQIDALNELLECGWIKEEKKGKYATTDELILTVHPLIEELIKIELSPLPQDNLPLIQSIENYELLTLLSENFEGFSDFMQVELDELVTAAERFSACLVHLAKDKSNIDFVIYEFNKYLNGNMFAIEIFFHSDYSYYSCKLLELMDNYIAKNTVHAHTLCYYHNIKEILSTTDFICIPKKNEPYTTETHFLAAFDCISYFEDSIRNEMIWKICKPIVQLVEEYACFTEEAEQVLSPMVKKIKEFNSIVDEKLDGVYLSHWGQDDEAERQKIDQTYEEIDNAKLPEDMHKDAIWDFEEQNKGEFVNGVDVQKIADRIDGSEQLSNTEKIEQYYTIFEDCIFQKVWCCHGDITEIRERISKLPWARALDLLYREEDYYIQDDIQFEDERYAYELDDFCDSFRAVCIGYLEGATEDFDRYLRYSIDRFKHIVNHGVETNGKIPYFFYEFEDLCSFFYYGAFKAFVLLKELKKAHLVLPYIIECSNYIEEKLKVTQNYFDTKMYCWYKLIMEFFDATDDELSVEESLSYSKKYNWSFYYDKLQELNPQNDLRSLHDDE